MTDIEPDFYSNSAKGSSRSQLSESASEEEFEDALTEARAESNLSRANVVRKIKAEKTQTDDADGPTPPAERPRLAGRAGVLSWLYARQGC